MASLVPCAVCQRHVRHHESACPFCGAERKPTAGPVRERGLVRDAKRATLVALGLTLTSPACGGREDEGQQRDNSGIVPPYGLSPDFSQGGNGGAGGTANGGTGGASGSAGQDNGDLTVPPYGAMPPPDIPDGNGGGGGADAPDSGTPPDAGDGETPSEDAGTSSDPA
jgi:hypothetical protein